MSDTEKVELLDTLQSSLYALHGMVNKELHREYILCVLGICVEQRRKVIKEVSGCSKEAAS